MRSEDTSREPCPDRILDDAGGAFAMGLGGSTLYHLFRGAINSPRGEKLSGAFQTMRMSAPRTGGGFAAWGALFSTFDCGMNYVRQKEDPWNSILAGAATGGLLQVRYGVMSAAKSAAAGAAFLALIEGAGIMLHRMHGPPLPTELAYQDPTVVATGTESSGWFGGLFAGGKNQEEKASGSSDSSETKVLETCDTLPPPMPSFDFK
ncbi:mitochondrial import inner membrane translocase subunit TIM17-1-like isoform X1 [Silene latifolia]|uniref:mitochondrial import inner membrane translocase subunit TIM17-1-like isoform X1 n=1 Tax=Silene latifolia TaxID=37657 RepID=UPI003D783206